MALLLHWAGMIIFYNIGGPLLPVAWMIAIFCYFAIEVMMNAISGELFPTSCRTTAASLRTIVGILAAAAGLTVEGSLFQYFGDHGSAISVMVFSTLLAIPVVVFCLRETANEHLH